MWPKITPHAVPVMAFEEGLTWPTTTGFAFGPETD